MIINVKAASTRYGLSRFWIAKVHSSSSLTNFYSIFFNDIFATFFTSYDLFSSGITYDYSVFHFSSQGLSVDIFLQDSMNEELNYISRSKDSKFFNFIFPFFSNSELNKRFKFSSSPSSVTPTKFLNLKTSLLFKSKIKKSFKKKNKIDFFKTFTLSNYFKKNIRRFWFYKFRINLHSNEFKSFSPCFSKSTVIKFLKSSYTFTSKKNFRLNLSIFSFFLRRYVKRNYNLYLSTRKFRFIDFFNPFARLNTHSSRYRATVFVPFFTYTSVTFRSSSFFLFFNNHKFAKKIFSSAFFKNCYRKNRIKYLKRRQKSKNFFFSSKFVALSQLFRFYSKILKNYLISFFPIKIIRIYRVKYTNINVNAFVFYSAVKLYYKYMLNDIIRPLIRGASRYYTGFFVLCKGRFTRAQIASKRTYRRNFINYNRMHYPIYYSIKSVALRYGASTVHIWLQH